MNGLSIVLLILFRPKHPIKVHVWGGISWNGPTPLVIFEGVMDADGYINVLTSGLLPYISRQSHTVKFMQDNDPKHTSCKAKEWMEQNNVHWWKTPAESPDLNPIENMWHELKEYLRREVKPMSKDELINGIHEFWSTVTVEKCRRYIRHLRKVVPKVIALEGGPTGY